MAPAPPPVPLSRHPGAATGVGYRRRHVSGRHAEVVRPRSGRAHGDPVVERVVVDGDRAENRGLDHRLAPLRHLESERMRLGVGPVRLAAGARIPELLLPGPRPPPKRVEGPGVAPAPISPPPP